MGVDVTSKLILGSCDIDIENKIPEFVKEYIEEAGDQIPEDAKGKLKDFRGFYLWKNAYNSWFEGFGVDYDPNITTKENNALRRRVIKVFEKYGLGEPKIVSFSHWW